MQLVKLLAGNKNIYQGFIGKMRQILAASYLESQWSKAHIFEAYLNLIPFRGEYRGLNSIFVGVV